MEFGWSDEERAFYAPGPHTFSQADVGTRVRSDVRPQGRGGPRPPPDRNAARWGGHPASIAAYEGVTPERNDGKTVYRISP